VILATHEANIATKADVVLEMKDGRVKQVDPIAN
jgi:ABC-type lipoprotein export system ATPase subunit